MEVTDYLHDEAGDLQASGGDFVKGESAKQNQEDLLFLCPGEIKADPTAGVGIIDFLLNEASREQVESTINDQFTADGIIVEEINFASIENVIVSGSYEKSNS